MNTCCTEIRHIMIGVVAATALLAGSAFASPMNPEARGERLAQALDLTEPQRVAVEQAIQEHRELVAGINRRNEDGSINPDARAEMQAARELLQSSIREQLDPAQAQRFDAMAQRMRERGNRQRGGGQGPMRALASLDLTEAQRDSIRELMSAHHDNKRAPRQELYASLQTVLTEEQFAELQQMRARRGTGQGGHGPRN